MRDGSWYREFTVDYCSGGSEVFHLETPEEKPEPDDGTRKLARAIAESAHGIEA